jgi:cupin 2 domain-containing protein
MLNLLKYIPANANQEHVDSLVHSETVRIERIVSQGQSSPAGFWYDQPENEWVMLLQGAARLNVEGELLELRPGDSINLPRHCRHRVEWRLPTKLQSG